MLLGMMLSGCKATQPGAVETKVLQEAKELTIGGKDWQNPSPDDAATRASGAEHFRHHCSVCHGLDGQNTGVPFAEKMSPPVANLASPDIQKYSDGQLKWIIENGIRLSGMPAWKGILSDDEMWHIVRSLRHLPEKGSLGAPEIYRESADQHKHSADQHKH